MWAYEHGHAGLSQRELHLGDQVSKGSMAQRFAACRELLSYDPENRKMLNRCRTCGDRFPCQVKYCDKCFGWPLDKANWHVDPSRFIGDDVLNPVIYNDHVGHGAFRHVQRVQKMMEPFYGLPVSQIAPFTAKFCYLQGGEDYVAVKAFYHKWMREVGLGFRNLVHPDVKFAYRFEWSWTTAGHAPWHLPLRAPGVADVSTMDPDQVVAFLHCHGAAYFPGFTYAEAGQFFRMVFDGPSQVHVATPKSDTVVDVGGSAGLLEIEDLALRRDDHSHLPDHPDDAYHCFDSAPSHLDSEISIDLRLDALAAALQLEDEDYEDPTDAPDRSSGLAGFFQYTCKDHLPKSESRYEKLAMRAGASDTGNKSSEGCADSEVSSGKVLTPEQMVIACHGDAELKRAFHGKPLTHTFGVVKKANAESKKALQESSQESSGNTGSKTSRDIWTSDRTAPFGVSTEPLAQTSVHWCVGTPSKDDHTQHQLMVPPEQTNPPNSYTYKEVARSPVQNALFHWLSAIWRFMMCLGLRVLRPP